jgi:hypothetical protein
MWNIFVMVSNTVLVVLHPTSKRTYTIRTIVEEIGDACHRKPGFSAIISTLVRSAPIFNLNDEEIEENKAASVWKEINASSGQDRQQILDYSLWFGDAEVDRPLSVYLPPAPGHNHRIRNTFLEWRNHWVERQYPIFPQLTSDKWVGRLTAFKFVEASGGTNPDIEDHRVTVVDLERYYSDTGEEIQGPCELRQAWKYNDLTPRTYFALGGTHFHASKYIREIANSLCNAFPETNFKTRFSIHRIPITSEKLAFTYDYSSFTSNLTELKYFLTELAEYTRGVQISVIDSRKGPILRDLGELLDSYNLSVNVQGEYTINRFFPDILTPLNHMKAGMLGVYGNIALSTNLHGLHACQLCGDTSECNCVGDDVFGCGTAESFEDFADAVTSLGETNLSKTKSWPYRDEFREDIELEDRSWPYTKRPLTRFENRMNLATAYFLPIFGAVIPIIDGVHDIQSEEFLPEHYRLLSLQMCSFYRQMFACPPTQEEIPILRSYCWALYTMMRIPEGGVLPFERFSLPSSTSISGLLLPNLGYFESFDVWAGFGIEMVPERVSIPRICAEGQWGLDALPRLGSMICPTSKELVYGMKMTWLSVEALYMDASFPDFSSYKLFYDNLFERRSFRLYEYTLLACPKWYRNLLSASSVAR